MKTKNVILTFILVFVIVLSGFLLFKCSDNAPIISDNQNSTPSGVSTVTLNVTATATDVVVTDSKDNVIALNGGVLTVGNRYTVTMTPISSANSISKFQFNGVDRLGDITNNTFSFICVESVNMQIESGVSCHLSISGYEYGNFWVYVSPTGNISDRETVADEEHYLPNFVFPMDWKISVLAGLAEEDQFFDIYVNNVKYSVTYFEPDEGGFIVQAYDEIVTFTITESVNIRFEYPKITIGDNCTIGGTHIDLNETSVYINDDSGTEATSLVPGQSYRFFIYSEPGYQITDVNINGLSIDCDIGLLTDELIGHDPIKYSRAMFTYEYTGTPVSITCTTVPIEN